MGSRAYGSGGLMLLAVVASNHGCTCSGEETPLGSGPAPRISATGDRLSKSGYGHDVEPENFKLSTDEKRALLELARASVETWVRSGKLIDVPPNLTKQHPVLGAERACFVTLRQGNQLRGCIGSLQPQRALAEDVRQNAKAAAVHDTRFRPVGLEELDSLSYSISVLELPRLLEGVAASDLPGYMAEHRPGVIIEFRGQRSTFLPSVWDELRDPVQFLSRLCEKQGSPANCWKDPDVRISTYGAIHFAEKDLP